MGAAAALAAFRSVALAHEETGESPEAASIIASSESFTLIFKMRVRPSSPRCFRPIKNFRVKIGPHLLTRNIFVTTITPRNTSINNVFGSVKKRAAPD